MYKKGQKVWVLHTDSQGVVEVFECFYDRQQHTIFHLVRGDIDGESLFDVRDEDLFTDETTALQKAVAKATEQVQRYLNQLKSLVARMQ